MEFALICAFIIGSVIHCSGFGLLYVNRINTVVAWLLLALNLCILISLAYDRPLRYNIFGVKQLSSVALLISLLDIAKEKFRLSAETGKDIQHQRRHS